jgi:hypothetical protein
VQDLCPAFDNDLDVDVDNIRCGSNGQGWGGHGSQVWRREHIGSSGGEGGRRGLVVVGEGGGPGWCRSSEVKERGGG